VRKLLLNTPAMILTGDLCSTKKVTQVYIDFKILDKTLCLKTDLADNDFPVTSLTSFIDEIKARKSLEAHRRCLADFVAALSDFATWGSNCRIENFDLSGYPISSSAAKVLSVLSRIAIPEGWPQITSEELIIFLGGVGCRNKLLWGSMWF